MAEDDVTRLSKDELIAEARRMEAARHDAVRSSGRLLAALHDTHGLSWPEIERVTGVARSTAHRRARPYLMMDD